MSEATKGPWRYEAETSTIRAMPANYWIATMDSFDGAVSNEANARLIAEAPAMRDLLTRIWRYHSEHRHWIMAGDTGLDPLMDEARAILRRIEG